MHGERVSARGLLLLRPRRLLRSGPFLRVSMAAAAMAAPWRRRPSSAAGEDCGAGVGDPSGSVAPGPASSTPSHGGGAGGGLCSPMAAVSMAGPATAATRMRIAGRRPPPTPFLPSSRRAGARPPPASPSPSPSSSSALPGGESREPSRRGACGGRKLRRRRLRGSREPRCRGARGGRELRRRRLRGSREPRRRGACGGRELRRAACA